MLATRPALTDTSRRSLLTGGAASCALLCGSSPALLPGRAAAEQTAFASPPPAWQPLSVVLSLSRGASLAEGGPNAAVYVTARAPGRGTPPLAAKRVPLPPPPLAGDAWTLRVVLNDSDAVVDPASASSSFEAVSRAWAAATELSVSARFDVDGVAATRDEGDLVGRVSVRRRKSEGEAGDNASWSDAAVALGGRGFGGRLVTRRDFSGR